MINKIIITIFYKDGKALMKKCNEKTFLKSLVYIESAILRRDDVLKVEIKNVK